MKKEIDLKEARLRFPVFPVVLVTVRENIIAIGLIHTFSFDPPMLGIGVHPKRHSYQLLKEIRDFGVNIPTVKLVNEVNICGTVSGRNVNKFKESGLTQMKPKIIKSVLIEECPVNFECKVTQELSFGGSHNWFVGEVVVAYQADGYDKTKALSYWDKEYRVMGDLVLKR